VVIVDAERVIVEMIPKGHIGPGEARRQNQEEGCCNEERQNFFHGSLLYCCRLYEKYRTVMGAYSLQWQEDPFQLWQTREFLYSFMDPHFAGRALAPSLQAGYMAWCGKINIPS